MNQPRLYFDQAATSWPKLPEAVLAASQFLNECGATSGRGAYASARLADSWLSRCRTGLAKLVGATGYEDIALCSSGTHALNALLLGLLEPGDHVVTTDIEHNSVLRPLEHLRRTANVAVSWAPCDGLGRVDLRAAERLLEKQTRAVVISHASNVTGRRQDIALWSQLAHARGALLIVDASQTLGYLPLSMQQAGIDALATAGHKGLGGLPGTGFIAATEKVRSVVKPIMFGGTGTASEQLDFSPSWPQSIEVGNLNLPAAVSMAVAAETWMGRGEAAKLAWQQSLKHLLSGLRELESLGRMQIIGHGPSTDPEDELLEWLPIVSLKFDKWDIHELSSVLDSAFGIETRAGFHCAARIHNAIGSFASGGTLRISLGHETTTTEVDQLVLALREVL